MNCFKKIAFFSKSGLTGSCSRSSGPIGPMGPEGPVGPVGPEGPISLFRLVLDIPDAEPIPEPIPDLAEMDPDPFPDPDPRSLQTFNSSKGGPPPPPDPFLDVISLFFRLISCPVCVQSVCKVSVLLHS